MSSNDVSEQSPKPGNIFQHWNATRPDYESRPPRVEEVSASTEPTNAQEQIIKTLTERKDNLLKRFEGIKKSIPGTPRVELLMDEFGAPSPDYDDYDPDGVGFHDRGFFYYAYNSPFISRLGEKSQSIGNLSIHNNPLLRASFNFWHNSESNTTGMNISQLFDPEYQNLVGDIIAKAPDPEEAELELEWGVNTGFIWEKGLLTKRIDIEGNAKGIDKEFMQGIVVSNNLDSNVENYGASSVYFKIPINQRDVNIINGGFGFIERHLNANFPPEEPKP